MSEDVRKRYCIDCRKAETGSGSIYGTAVVRGRWKVSHRGLSKVKRRRNVRSEFLSNASFDERSGTRKIERDKWWAAFWRYLDENPDVGQIVRRWQKAGCDPRNIAIPIHRYVIGYSNRLLVDRKKRKKRTRKVLAAAIRSLVDLEDLCRLYEQYEDADRFAKERKLLEERLSRIPLAFGTKRLGISRPWTDLAKIEGLVFETTKQRPSAREIVCLIKAGRTAAGQVSDPWEMDPAIIRKGLKNFKKRNPSERGFSNNPSSLLMKNRPVVKRKRT
jgi:hypothetical protein